MGRGAQQRRQGRRPGYFSAVTSYFSKARSRSRVSAISAAERNQLSFRVLRKFGILVLCVLRSDLAPEAWRRCHPMNPPITMTTSAMKTADPVTPASPPALPPRAGYRGARQRYSWVSDTAALTIPLCTVNCAAIAPLRRMYCSSFLGAYHGEAVGVWLVGVGGFGPYVDVSAGRVPGDRAQLVPGEPLVTGRLQVLLELGHAARTDQHGGDAVIAQRPGQRHLRE